MGQMLFLSALIEGTTGSLTGRFINVTPDKLTASAEQRCAMFAEYRAPVDARLSEFRQQLSAESAGPRCLLLKQGGLWPLVFEDQPPTQPMKAQSRGLEPLRAT